LARRPRSEHLGGRPRRCIVGQGAAFEAGALPAEVRRASARGCRHAAQLGTTPARTDEPDSPPPFFIGAV